MTITCRVRLPEGGKAAHCTACHETFTTPANFDRHRRGPDNNRRCLDPSEVGLVRVARKDYAAWSMPGRNEDAG
jgi:hypothetical protein